MRKLILATPIILGLGAVAPVPAAAQSGTTTEVSNIIRSAWETSGYWTCLRDGLTTDAQALVLTPDQEIEAKIQEVVTRQESKCDDQHDDFINILRTKVRAAGYNGGFDASQVDVGLHNLMVASVRDWLRKPYNP